MVDTIQLQRISHFFFRNRFSKWDIRLFFFFIYFQCFVYCVLYVLRPKICPQCVLLVHGALKMCTAEVWTDRSVCRMLLFFSCDRYLCWARFVLCFRWICPFSIVCICVHWIFSAETVNKNTKQDWIYKWHHFKLATLFKIEQLYEEHFWFFLHAHRFHIGMNSVSNFSITFSSHSFILSDVM